MESLDIEKTAQYWLKSAEYDFETAKCFIATKFKEIKKVYE